MRSERECVARLPAQMGAAWNHHASVEPTAELAQAVSQLATERGVPTTYISATGDPVATLMKIADHNHADALVVGSSRGFLPWFAGSKSIRAIRRSRCPVTVVP